MRKLKITFAEGCFDELSEEMTQQEIDALTSEIKKLVETGELFDHAQDLSDEEVDMILGQLDGVEKNTRQ